MREIKFRGKRLDNGEWVYGDLHIRTPFPHIHSEIDYRRVKIDPHTVGQFTGLHDKNGKEIYEGDILIEPNIFELPRHVFWDDRFARWGNISPTTHGYIALHDYNRPEIIGNIHDNPGLLKTE